MPLRDCASCADEFKQYKLTLTLANASRTGTASGDPWRFFVCRHGAVGAVRGLETLAQLTAFFHAFVLSCFRDPLGDFVFRELNVKTHHENTKV